MSDLKIVAKIIAKPEKIEFVKSELIKLIDTTRAEEGCIQYELQQDNEVPSIFFFIETWVSEAHLEKHLANDHIKAYAKNTEGCLEDFILNKNTVVK